MKTTIDPNDPYAKSRAISILLDMPEKASNDRIAVVLLPYRGRPPMFLMNDMPDTHVAVEITVHDLLAEIRDLLKSAADDRNDLEQRIKRATTILKRGGE